MWIVYLKSKWSLIGWNVRWIDDEMGLIFSLSSKHWGLRDFDRIAFNAYDHFDVKQ
jgi:hypothetical protein